MFIAADARRYFCIFSITSLFFSLPVLAAAAGMAAVELLIKMQAVAAEVATRIQIGVTQLCILKGFKQAMESL